MGKRFPYPKRYWIYVIIILICSILLIGNIYRTDSWTGDKPFSEFSQRDWHLFFIFLIEEMVIIGLISLFLYLCFRISKNRDKEILAQDKEILAQWEADKYSGIEPGDYDYVWFDFANTDRALILKQGDTFRLNVQEYDYNTGNWESVGTSIYDNLEAIKEALFYEYDFYCEENAELDKHGDEIYKET